jgi:hypothetical protein|tara:strand:- start:209 stop:400 length:192 start_codon:yes stop_codon:yes gene_type:complete
MRMNQQTKLLFALEHIAHLEDLFEDNADGALLSASLRDIKFILDRQYNKLHNRRQYRLDELQE